MPAVRIQFVFLQQSASGRQKIAEAEQEQEHHDDDDDEWICRARHK